MESLALLFCYFFYVLFMKYNIAAEKWVKSKLKQLSWVNCDSEQISVKVLSQEFKIICCMLRIINVDKIGFFDQKYQKKVWQKMENF